jgi:hypothetical protein
MISGFRNRFLLAPYYMPGGNLVKFFFSGSPLLELARGFLPASRDSFNGGVTSDCRKRFHDWFFLQVPELLASGPQPELHRVTWQR